jgi:PAS domain S-box-containing protein
MDQPLDSEVLMKSTLGTLAEAVLHAAGEPFRQFFEESPLAMILVEPSRMLIAGANRQALAVFGYAADELVGKSIEALTYPGDVVVTGEKYAELHGSHPGALALEKRYLRRDGSWFWAALAVTALRTPDGAISLFTGTVVDITHFKRFDAALRESNERMSLFVEYAPAALAMFDRDMRYLAASRRWMRDYGLKADIVGNSHYEVFPEIPERWKDAHRRGLAGEVVRNDEDLFVRADGFRQWLRWEIRPWRAATGEVGGIVIFSEDITELVRAREATATHASELEEAMHGTLLAVSNMVEQRDPYTAGHERRVGIIARDIAREMGWPEQQCRDLELIGLVHDIGKIAVPVEILTKPSRLSAMEYELVKQHVTRSYEILKDVKFRIPIAEIIYQHHERMDGSGYPRGLRGREILPAARILAVADVAESMAAHRPYRPALGLEAALGELTGRSGSLYDAEVVATLERMVRYRGYTLPE